MADQFLTSQLEPVNKTLQALYDEVGLSLEERQNKQRSLLDAISRALESQVHLVTQERDELYSDCENLRNSIYFMLKALKDVDMSSVMGRNAETMVKEPVTGPLLARKQGLQSAHATIEELLSDRLVRVNKILRELKSYQSKVDSITISEELVPSILTDETILSGHVEHIRRSLKSSNEAHEDTMIQLDLSRSKIFNLEQEVIRFKEEYHTNVKRASILANSIVSLWVDLGTPQSLIDDRIMQNYKNSPEELGTLTADLARLEHILEELRMQKDQRETKLHKLKEDVNRLWDRLDEDQEYMDNFRRHQNGLTESVLNAYEEELERLNEKKKQHIHIFIEHARQELQQLWSQLYFSEEETYLFRPAWCDVFTDASLEAHETEIARLMDLVEQRKPLLNLVENFRQLQEEERELEESSHDASRLLSRGGNAGRLLREEKLRSHIARTKPRVLQELKIALENWVQETGKDFCIDGEDFLKLVTEEQEKLQSKSRRRPVGARSVSSNITTTGRAVARTISPQKSPVKSNGRTIPPRTERPNNRSVTAPSVVSNRVTKQIPRRAVDSRAVDSRTDTRTLPRRIEDTRQVTRQSPVQKVTRPKIPNTADAYSRSPIHQKSASPVNLSVRCVGKPALVSPSRGYLKESNRQSPFQSYVNSPTKHMQSPSPTKSVPVLKIGSPFRLRPDMERTPMNKSSPHSEAKSSPFMTLDRETSDNWKVYDDESSDGEFSDPNYIKWRQEEMKKLGLEGKGHRESDFNWNKHTF